MTTHPVVAFIVQRARAAGVPVTVRRVRRPTVDLRPVGGASIAG